MGIGRLGFPAAALSRHRDASSLTRIRKIRGLHHSARRWRSQPSGHTEGPGHKGRDARQPRSRNKLPDREFFQSILETRTTKRDAKPFLARFLDDQPQKVSRQLLTSEETQCNAVNLGTLYAPIRAMENNPVFTQHKSDQERRVSKSTPATHVVIVKIRELQSISDDVLSGIATTLGQLGKLGVHVAAVIDPVSDGPMLSKVDVEHQCDRLLESLEQTSAAGGRVVDSSLGLSQSWSANLSGVPLRGLVDVKLPSLIFGALKHGKIAIIPPIAASPSLQLRLVDADEVVLALTRQFAGQTDDFLRSLTAGSEQATRPHHDSDSDSLKFNLFLDRIIILDPLGGLPDPWSPSGSRIFVNLEQDYQSARSNLGHRETRAQDSSGSYRSASTSPDVFKASQHIRTLDCIQRCLTLLPPSASALLLTPKEVAESALGTKSSHLATGVRTRPKRNPLIHNILTDKPLVSSSLPEGRLSQGIAMETTSNTSTFFKRGMPLTIIPDPIKDPWSPPPDGMSDLQLETDPRIDFPRLLHLIEDSFGRQLDVRHYLNRIKSRVAGIIVAGNYEGGAILTWEEPAGRPGRPLVPYLDKFAVLRKSQGSGGVADIVFNAMVHDCFPKGVVWRSRRNNPVNKWYFERATGTFKVPRSHWTMFWTGKGPDFDSPDLEDGSHGRHTWEDYVAVCENIAASWADQKPPD